ncbi:MAG: 5'/3'-nucleotidase SurE [Polyangiales bacterium]
MRILVTNDDSVYSPGIAALAEAASAFGEVRIVAPDVEQSSMAHAVTSSRPLHIKSARVGKFDAFRVNGTPADCVALGSYVWGSVDLVFSGINLGLNVGNSMWHSGTLAAAKQASLLGYRGIAFSALEAGDQPDYDAIRPYLQQVMREVISCRDLDLVNINFPRKSRGVRWTRQSVRHYDGRVQPARDPMGREIYWIVPMPLEAPEAGTDRWAVEHDFVSLTPLRLDLTDHDELRDRLLAEAAE